MSYLTPYRVEKLSGDKQTGTTGQYLASPIRVKVTDKNGLAAKNIKVQFKVVTGGGSVSVSTATTDASGTAQTNWLLGSGSGQTLQASVADASGTAIDGSPVTFTAN
ncbi:MAG: hypothetical protein EBZ77_05295 [Chitinophagia bacterium]|nr:hypothetical protein [Chitinophagia bacterium]